MAIRFMLTGTEFCLRLHFFVMMSLIMKVSFIASTFSLKDLIVSTLQKELRYFCVGIVY